MATGEPLDPWKRDRLLYGSWVRNITFPLSASDLVIIADSDLFRQQPSAQDAVFHCIGGRDYRRLVYYFR